MAFKFTNRELKAVNERYGALKQKYEVEQTSVVAEVMSECTFSPVHVAPHPTPGEATCFVVL